MLDMKRMRKTPATSKHATNNNSEQVSDVQKLAAPNCNTLFVTRWPNHILNVYYKRMKRKASSNKARTKRIA